MKAETKLWLRKRALMALRSIVWHVDEWIQRQEVSLREELAAMQAPAQRAERPRVLRAPAAIVKTETFEQWEMRKSGVRPVAKDLHHRRHRHTAAEFDQEIAQRAKEYVQ